MDTETARAQSCARRASELLVVVRSVCRILCRRKTFQTSRILLSSTSISCEQVDSAIVRVAIYSLAACCMFLRLVRECGHEYVVRNLASTNADAIRMWVPCSIKLIGDSISEH
jgi:hypothetical protein